MKSFYFKQSHPNKVELDSDAYTKKRQYYESEVTEIFNLRIRSSCLLYEEIYFQLGVIHIDGILRCFNSIVFVCSMAFLSNNDRSKIVTVSQISTKYGYL